ncbi:hypothetical protein BHAOGJBA_6350 [Methylobacterium hispanicum]|uniref:Uncharacterized protein n=2 Tax=Methylobacterium hispanicum TaxID=270350 RepID=A0AAV4ZYH7_9HYPH|nr:hypothetical protein BHAOGJBA_6350 [Methylobacterium hispanicum]
MGDRADTSIMIVGTIPSAAAVTALTAAVVAENAKPGWEEGVFEDGDFMCLLQETIEQGKPLWIYGSDKLGATMDDVEDVCREHGIAFAVHGERGPSWDSFVKRWMPGWPEPVTVYGSDGPSIGAAKVASLLRSGPEGIAELTALADRLKGVDLPEIVDASPQMRKELERLIQVEYGETGPMASAPTP